jgi:hypothetical protein
MPALPEIRFTVGRGESTPLLSKTEANSPIPATRTRISASFGLAVNDPPTPVREFLTNLVSNIAGGSPDNCTGPAGARPGCLGNSPLLSDAGLVEVETPLQRRLADLPGAVENDAVEQQTLVVVAVVSLLVGKPQKL